MGLGWYRTSFRFPQCASISSFRFVAVSTRPQNPYDPHSHLLYYLCRKRNLHRHVHLQHGRCFSSPQSPRLLPPLTAHHPTSVSATLLSLVYVGCMLTVRRHHYRVLTCSLVQYVACRSLKSRAGRNEQVRTLRATQTTGMVSIC